MSQLQEVQQNIEERAILVSVDLPDTPREQVDLSLAELEELVKTAGAKVYGKVQQKRRKLDPAFLIGRGKLDEIRDICDQHKGNLVVFNRELSPAQKGNLEEALDLKVLDRTEIILDIFANRARTKEGKLQVELAQLSYLLPRLRGAGHQLSRLGGGIGTRGPGETKLEVDRRKIRDRIARLKKEIEAVRNHRKVQRQNKERASYPLIALCGYTNAGKSTLFNTLTIVDNVGVSNLNGNGDKNLKYAQKGAGVLVEDKLFATLDPTFRKITIPRNLPVYITDTVGFIQNLPHHLVAAFKATLEEIQEADLILHVVDLSHPMWESQVEAVEKVLHDLDVQNDRIITVYNKIDNVSEEDRVYVNETDKAVMISAIKGWGIDDLHATVEKYLGKDRNRCKFFIPYKDGHVLSAIMDSGNVIGKRHINKGTVLEMETDKITKNRYSKYILD